MSVRDVEATFAGAVAISSAAQSLKSGAFDSLYSTWGSSFAPARGYTRHPSPQVGTLLRLSTVELSHMCMSFQPNRLVAAQRPLQPNRLRTLPRNPQVPMAFRVSPALPAPGLEEHWRRVYLDVTTPPLARDLAAGAPFLKVET